MTDLTDRMRTCAAHLCTIDALEINEAKYEAIIDAAALLIEASNIIEAAAQPQYPPSVPMEVLPTLAEQYRAETEDIKRLTGTWVAPGDTLPVARPYRSPRACPKCDSRVVKRVRRIENKLMIECPVCAETWEFK